MLITQTEVLDMSVMRIGVLTSGGDTPGMNAAIRAVVRRGLSFGDVVLGVYHGYEGLMDGRVKQLQSSDVHGIIQRGGTILRTARSEVFRTPEGQAKAMQLMTAYEMDALIVIGGDGSFHGAQALAELGMNVMGIPGTIDNDIGYTDFTIGFDTAVNNVMGEDWGEAASQLMHNKLMGRFTSMVIIAEGAGKAEDFAKFVQEHTDVEIKPVVLSYIQRGGAPTAADRMLATRLGARAVELIHEGVRNRALGIHDNHIVDVDIKDSTAHNENYDHSLYELHSKMNRIY